jgi:DNA polymerase
MTKAAARGEDLEIELPDGGSMIYRKCRQRRLSKKAGGGSEIVADIMHSGRETTIRLWASFLYQNCCQRIARCAFRDCLLRLHEHGYKVVLQVHDEAVVEVPEEEAEFHRNKIEQLMSVSPSWAPGLPVASEATICKKYSEAK